MSNINSKFVKQSKKRLTAAKKVFLIVIVLIIATVVIVSSILLARKFAIKSARQSDSKRAQQLVYGSNIVVEISSSAQFPSCSGLEPFYPSVEKIYTNPNGRQFDIS
ncbi:MAG: hypothetical protein LBM73_01335, partial [Candidatus Nomurabacteria bacterium]|nr:hypothetical protein [Candidatus Nomurabacteria bacterium]